ncbi:MAG TPA: histidinol dehydrogenase [Saprospiraceae bacterium]|nr:histidinol dehydrogenase [Saprospiraceae bacterium]
MKIYHYPKKQDWPKILQRPVFENSMLEKKVQTMLEKIKAEGDKAIQEFTRQFDGVDLASHFLVSSEEIKSAVAKIPAELKAAIQQAKENIALFHKSQQQTPEVIETMPGVKCWRKSVAIQKVGLYIPGGTAPLFSTILMLGVPAKIAGCQEIILCTPPDKNGKINDAILYTAQLVGIEKIYKIGGVQAIGAMAFGTQTIPSVYKIFGPGNQFVTTAKQLVQKYGLAIDMPAGPSEVLVLLDKTAKPAYVAADLLSQAEHGVDSQVVMLTLDKECIALVQLEIQKQLALLPRKEIAHKALQNSCMIALHSEKEAIDLINEYAPEHLILNNVNADETARQIVNAGSIFIGAYSPESVGDYASGTNHTLPTNGYARAYSGVSLDSFYKKITFQKLTKKGLENIGAIVEKMAIAEHLHAHANAVRIRLEV